MSETRLLFNGCPLCESKKIAIHAVVDDCSQHALYHPAISKQINWMHCESCQHVFTDGYLSDEALELIFSKTQDRHWPGFKWEDQRFVSAKIVEKISSYVKMGSWLDVGFGNGSLLFTADEWGFKTVGLDLRQSSVDKMIKDWKFEVYCKDLCSFSSLTKFSVISIADCLEHLPFPKLELNAAHRLLEPNGVLFLSMPNYDCAAWRLADSNNTNPYWTELEHYHNFSRERLYSLLYELGFKPIHYGISERYRICMEVIARVIK